MLFPEYDEYFGDDILGGRGIIRSNSLKKSGGKQGFLFLSLPLTRIKLFEWDFSKPLFAMTGT